MCFIQTFSDVCETVWKKKTQVKLAQEVMSVRVIAGEIWCCCRDASIVIFDDDLTRKRKLELSTHSADAINDVAMMPGGDLIIARPSGLYHTDMHGKET